MEAHEVQELSCASAVLFSRYGLSRDCNIDGEGQK